jgi:hypothetical protein
MMNETQDIPKKDILFPPKATLWGKYILTDLRKEYPELNSIDEFKPLKNAEMYFVWVFACPGSDIENTDVPLLVRRRKAVNMAFLEADGKTIRHGYDKEYFENAIAGVFTEEVNQAIRRMEMFNPNVRMQAKILSEKVLKNYVAFIDKDSSEIQDTDERKKYVDMCDKILDALPKLIEKVESGYGIKSVVQRVGVDNHKGKTLMDLAHEEEKKHNG